MNMVLVNFVSYYATQVRAALGGLSQDVVDELTDGLEADLIDAMSDGETEVSAQDITLNHLIERFGKPSRYAEELVSAAGIDAQVTEPVGKAPKQSLVRKANRAARKSGSKAINVLNAQSWWPAVREFLIELRPVWWVLRALPVYAFFAVLEKPTRQLIPRDLPHWLFLTVLVVFSVLLGRHVVAGKVKGNWTKALWALNAVAVVALLPMIATYSSYDSRSFNNGYNGGYNNGYNDGRSEAQALGQGSGPQVVAPPGFLTNGGQDYFVYDSSGALVPDARIISNSGDPVQPGAYPVRLSMADGQLAISNFQLDEFGAIVLNTYPNGFTAVSENQYCSSEAAEFWSQLKSEAEVGVLDPASTDSTIAYKYTDADEFGFMYFGQSATGTQQEGCYLGIKIPTDQSAPAAPLTRLPKLGAASQEETPAEGTDQSPSTDGSEDSPQPSGEPTEPSAEDTTKPSTEPEKLDGAALDTKLAELKKALEEAKTAKDEAKVKEINALIADVNKQKADLEKAEQDKSGQDKPETPASKE